ncbi:hypothetical protein [Francisella persica]|uniref:hypothetical protein n=1 Tax=Francisella persica TaxID=954 RepID=UPI000AC61920|nr:hypothetical protein [Francisella persica]
MSDFYEGLLTSNHEPTLLQRSTSDRYPTSKIDMSKIPITPDITSAILSAETGKLCDIPEKFIF